MFRVPTALHLPITHDDNIAIQLVNCDENYKFLHIHIVFCRNLQLIIR